MYLQDTRGPAPSLVAEHVEMLTCIKDWELGATREQHTPEDIDLVDAFKNIYLDERGQAQGSGSGSGSTFV